jgi:hypothetical protein
VSNIVSIYLLAIDNFDESFKFASSGSYACPLFETSTTLKILNACR